jgi:hypothetical protein
MAMRLRDRLALEVEALSEARGNLMVAMDRIAGDEDALSEGRMVRHQRIIGNRQLEYASYLTLVTNLLALIPDDVTDQISPTFTQAHES